VAPPVFRRFNLSSLTDASLFGSADAPRSVLRLSRAASGVLTRAASHRQRSVLLRVQRAALRPTRYASGVGPAALVGASGAGPMAHGGGGLYTAASMP
jgi:hypothetical protein